MIENTPKTHLMTHQRVFFQWNALSLIIKHCMIMYTVYSFAFLTYHRLLGRWQGRKKNLERSSSSDSSFLGCLKCQPGRIYVLLADINVSVVFHEVNNEKVSPCPQNRRRARGCFNICSGMAKSIPTHSKPLEIVILIQFFTLTSFLTTF